MSDLAVGTAPDLARAAVRSATARARAGSEYRSESSGPRMLKPENLMPSPRRLPGYRGVGSGHHADPAESDHAAPCRLSDVAGEPRAVDIRDVANGDHPAGKRTKK